MKKEVIIVRDLELGWDNIVGVFDPEVLSMESFKLEFPEEDYSIQKYEIQVGLDKYV